MKDARSPAKREKRLKVNGDPTNESLAVSLGSYDDAVSATLAEAEKTNVVQRIWARDASLWKTEEAHQKIITNSLGWLTATAEVLAVSDELGTFAEAVRDAA